ncbi:MAG: DUF4493 domain-containing protein [Rikenellaceae bacterium]
MRLKITMLALLSAVVIVGCKDDESPVVALPDSDFMGSVSLSAATESSAILATRADEITNEVLEQGVDDEENIVAILPSRLDPTLDDVIIDIVGSYIIPDAEAGVQLEDGQVAELEFEPMSYADYQAQTTYLYASDYTVKMSYGDTTLEAVDNVCYYGELPIHIYARKESEETVTLKVCNSIVNKIVTTESFNNYYKLDECHFYITTSAGAQREFNIASGESAAEPVSESVLYFVEAGTTLTLSGTAVKSNDVEIKFSGNIGTTEAGRCYTITIDADDVGSTSIFVKFDDNISEFATTEVQDVDLRPSITE